MSPSIQQPLPIVFKLSAKCHFILGDHASHRRRIRRWARGVVSKKSQGTRRKASTSTRNSEDAADGSISLKGAKLTDAVLVDPKGVADVSISPNDTILSNVEVVDSKEVADGLISPNDVKLINLELVHTKDARRVNLKFSKAAYPGRVFVGYTTGQNPQPVWLSFSRRKGREDLKWHTTAYVSSTSNTITTVTAIDHETTPVGAPRNSRWHHHFRGPWIQRFDNPQSIAQSEAKAKEHSTSKETKANQTSPPETMQASSSAPMTLDTASELVNRLHDPACKDKSVKILERCATTLQLVYGTPDKPPIKVVESLKDHRLLWGEFTHRFDPYSTLELND